MSIKKHVILFLITVFSSVNALTLTEALDKSIEISPEIREKQKRYEEIYYDTKIAISGYLPKIDFIATSALKDSTIDNSRDNDHEIEFLFTQNIFSGFKDISKRNLELSKYGSALYTTKELVNSYSLEVIEAYLSLLREKKMLDIQRASLENHEEILEKITKKYNAGMGTQLELRLSKTSLNLAKINYHDQKNSRTQLKITLEKYLNEEVDVSSLTYPNDKVVIPCSIENALKIAYKNHPSMYIAKLNKQMSDYELQFTKKDLYPSLDFKAKYSTGENGIYQNTDEYYRMYFELSYNIYNGGSNINEKEKIKKKIAQKNSIIAKVKRDITHKLKSKFDEYLMLKERVRLLNNYVSSKELALESYYSQFSIGKANLQDILDTTESLYIAKRLALDGKFNLLISSYRVLEAMGSLPKISYHNQKVMQAINSEENKNIFSIKNSKKNCFIVSASKLNIRESMSTSSKILGKYNKDEIICIKKRENLWVQTDVGWVSTTYLKPKNKSNI